MDRSQAGTRIRRIGIFDSGAGGLTVLKELRKALNGVRFFYLGDTARLPYGTKSSDTIVRYTLQNTRFLITKRVDLMIVACNTASAYAIPAIREAFDIPVIGVIQPGAAAAVKATRSGKIGVIGTRATIQSHAYQQEIAALAKDATVEAIAAPLLVPLVEEGLINGPIAEQVVRLYVDPLLETDIDTLVLGCTHYPMLKPLLARMYPSLELVDSAGPIRDRLLSQFAFDPDGGRTEIYVTDYPEGFALLSQRFLEGEFDRIEHIDLQQLWRKKR